MGIIYCIENLVNGKKYIGSDTKNRSLREYSGSGIAIKQAIKKYGIENFTKTIIEEVDNNIIRERETYWLRHFDVANDGNYYNIIDYAFGQLTKTSFSKGHKLNVGRKRTAWNKGKKYTKEQYDKIVLGQTKRVQTIRVRNISRPVEEIKQIYGHQKGKTHPSQSLKIKALNASLTDDERKLKYSNTVKFKWYFHPNLQQNYYGESGTEPLGFIPGRKVKWSMYRR